MINNPIEIIDDSPRNVNITPSRRISIFIISINKISNETHPRSVCFFLPPAVCFTSCEQFFSFITARKMSPRSCIQLQQSDFVHMGIVFLSFEYVDIYASYSNISVVQNKKKWLTYCHCFFSWQFFHLNLVEKKRRFEFLLLKN